MKSKGTVIWLTGLSGAGKSTLGEALLARLNKDGCPVELLDGDVIRANLSKGLGFSKEDRDINVRRIGFVAELVSKYGVCVIVSAISPYREVRDEFKKTIPNFKEVFIKASIDEVKSRDPKGLYAKVAKGEIKNFTGIDDPYEEPLDPDLIINTEDQSFEESIAKLFKFVECNHTNYTK
jgi:adenylylsulfate kinase